MSTETETQAKKASTAEEFERYMKMARLIADGDYRRGYQRGLREFFQADLLTDAEKRAWARIARGDDPRHELARGYRDGLAGKPPEMPNADMGTP